MENKQHHYTGVCVILFIAALPASSWAAQPMSEGNLALQTGVLNNALPQFINQAKKDAVLPEQESWRSRLALSDSYLREIRIATILGGVLSPHTEQKRAMDVDAQEKKRAGIKPHPQQPDRFMIYDFDSDNVHVTYNYQLKPVELTFK